MSKCILITATTQSHICQFHKPLMKLFKQNGYEVHAAAKDNLALKNGLKMEYTDKVYDVPFERSPLKKENIRAYFRMSEILKENEYEVILCNTPMGGVITRLAANKYRKKGTTVYYMAHGFHFYKGAPVKNWAVYYPIERIMSKFTDKLITITNEDYNLANKHFGCEVLYIHGVGANTSKFFAISENQKIKLRNELGYSQDDKIILNVGELNANKNQKAIICTIAELIEQVPSVKLMIAGNGDNLETLEKLVDDLNIKDYVNFLGYVTDIQRYMNICDLLVACSYREGLPLNVMEAFLCGCPVVASDNRGHRELIQEGYNGFLVSADDISSYKQRIVETLNNRSVLSDNAIQSAEPYKDISVIQELKSIYGLN